MNYRVIFSTVVLTALFLPLQAVIDSAYLQVIDMGQDSVRFTVICYANLPHQPCNIVSEEVEVNDDTIRAKICYENGFFTTTCKRIDTIYLGTHAIEDKKIILYGFSTATLGCVTTLPKKDTFMFNYSPTSILPLPTSESEFTIAYSPIENNVSIRANLFFSRAMFSIIDLNGRVILAPLHITLPYNQVNISALSQGLYFALVETANERWVKKIVKE